MKQIQLIATNQTLEIKLSATFTTTAIWWAVERENDASWVITTWSASGTVDGTTPVTIVPAPGSWVIRTIKAISIYNNDTEEAQVTISRNDNGTKKDLVRKIFPSLLIFSTWDWNSNIIGGNVIWSTSSVDGHFVVFDGPTGKRIRDWGAIPTGIPWFLECLAFAISWEEADITTGLAKLTFRVPYDMTISSIKASLNAASSSGIPTFDINVDWVSIFSTLLTIDEGEKTSITAAVPAVRTINTLTADQEITVDIDVAGTGAKWAKIYIIAHQ